MVDVPDERLKVLTELEGSKKTVHAKVRFVDVPGGLTAQGIAEFRQTDALCIVLRAYGPDSDPTGELSSVHAELLLADLASIESALEKGRKQGACSSADAQGEVDILERAHALLDSERSLREEKWDDDELKFLRGFGALTLKPWMIVANVEEGAGTKRVAASRGRWQSSASLEAEVAGMDDTEARDLLAASGSRSLDSAR